MSARAAPPRLAANALVFNRHQEFAVAIEMIDRRLPRLQRVLEGDAFRDVAANGKPSASAVSAMAG
ncbi:hypothetical protein EGK76_05060 [Luteimonas sp. 100069]|nr:hypothetical protein EGK76_05060 [Luteimonas sp. 100069]